MEEVTVRFMQNGQPQYILPFKKNDYMRTLYKTYAEKTGELEDNIYFTYEGFKMNPEIRLFTVNDKADTIDLDVRFYNVKVKKRHSVMYTERNPLNNEDDSEQPVKKKIRKRNTMAMDIPKPMNKTFNELQDENVPKKKKKVNSQVKKKNLKDDLIPKAKKKAKRYSTVDNIPKKFKIQQNDYILCPKCQTNPIIYFDKYKIHLKKCAKNHTIENISIKEYKTILKNQETDTDKNEDIKCDNCMQNTKSNSNQFYRCLDCDKNLCPNCENNHRNVCNDEHIIIDYENKNFFCIFHNKKFVAYCNNCRKNLCLKCKKDHDTSHDLFSFKSEFPEEKYNEIKNGVDKIYSQLALFKLNIKEIIDMLNELITGLESYNNLAQRIVNNYNEKFRNYQVIRSICNINYDEVLKDIEKIVKEENIIKRTTNAMQLHEKMFPYDPFNDSFSKSSQNDNENRSELHFENSPKKKRNDSSENDKSNDSDEEFSKNLLKLEKDAENEKEIEFSPPKSGSKKSVKKVIKKKKKSDNIKHTKTNIVVDKEFNSMNPEKNIDNQPKNNFINKTSTFNQNQFFKPESNIVKAYYDENLWNQNNNYPDNENIDPNKLSEVTLRYKYKDEDNEVQVLGDHFVEVNRDKCKMILEGRECDICNIFKLYQRYPNNILEIKIKETSKITDMSKIFCNCINLIYLDDIAKWNMTNVTNISYFFYHCLSLTSLPDISRWNTNSVTDMSFIFCYCTALRTLPEIGKWNTSKVTNMSCMFRNCSLIESLPEIGNWNTSIVENMSGMFAYCFVLNSLPDVSKWNTTNVKTMGNMFEYCKSLQLIPGMEKWSTFQLKNKNRMFEACPSSLQVPVKFEEFFK